MDSPEFQTPKKSHHLLWFGIGAVILLVVIIAGLSLLVAGNTKKETAASPSPSAPPAVKVATKEDVQKNLSTLNESMKQAQLDQAAAKTAIGDAKTQVKVSN